MTTITLDQFKQLSSVLKDKDFAIVEDSIPKHLISGEVIPIEHVMHRRIHPDGYYYLSEATCGGGKNNDCFVGRASPTCDARSETKCGVYSLYSINSLRLTLDQALQFQQMTKG